MSKVKNATESKSAVNLRQRRWHAKNRDRYNAKKREKYWSDTAFRMRERARARIGMSVVRSSGKSAYLVGVACDILGIPKEILSSLEEEGVIPEPERASNKKNYRIYTTRHLLNLHIAIKRFIMPLNDGSFKIDKEGMRKFFEEVDYG